MPINRVEGDLSVRLTVEDGLVRRAYVSCHRYRGFENLMRGRAAMDSLVLTPRICGICGTAQQHAAVLALEDATSISPGPGACAVRNVALACEHFENNMRHLGMYFMPDFTAPEYAGRPFHDEAVERFTPLKGSFVAETLAATRDVLRITALLGGQWPHSSYMVPGGVTYLGRKADTVQCLSWLDDFQTWFETSLLGCSLDEWFEVDSANALEGWLEAPAHAQSLFGFYARVARETGLDAIGRGPDLMFSYGAFPEADGSRLIPAGLGRDGAVADFDPTRIVEDTTYSRYKDASVLPPHQGVTDPNAAPDDSAYSWAKAVRYDGQAAETGPLADLLVMGDPLIRDLAKGGSNVFVRQMARMQITALLIGRCRSWLTAALGETSFYDEHPPIQEGDGVGLTNAPRGALGHWISVRDGAVERYQIVTPTTWNGSPRDERGGPGPFEQALEGTPVEGNVEEGDTPVTVGHVVRSFDPCVVCAVHFIDLRKSHG